MRHAVSREPLELKFPDRDLRTFQLSKARRRLEVLKIEMNSSFRGEQRDRRLIQVYSILENILDILESQ
jgi:hypothetical protein